MNGVRGVSYLLKIGLTVIMLILLSCSGGDGTDGTGEKPRVSGTAATGKPVAMSTVTIKSKNGIRKTEETNSEGKFSFNLENLQGPYLVRVQVSDHHYLYSVASKSGTVNIHPLTDLIVRNWFKVRGRDVELEFDDNAELFNPPSEVEINAVKQALAAILSELFNVFGMPDSFDMINSAFNANGQDFDRLLDFIKVRIHDGKVNIRIKDPETEIEAELAEDLDLDTDLTLSDEISPQAKPDARILGFGASESEIIVVWTPFIDNIAITGYDVYRDGVKIATTPFPVFWDKNLDTGSSHCYAVRAFDAAQNYSSPLETPAPCPSTQFDTVPPMAPTSLTVTLQQFPSQDLYLSQLAWAPVLNDSVIAYEIYRSVNDAAYSATPHTTVIESPFTDIGLAPSTKYCYKLKAIDSQFLRSAESTAECVTTPADTTTLTPVVDPIANYTTSLDLTVTGVAEPFSVVTVQGGAATASGNASDSGAFSIAISLIANASNNLSVFASDPSNNISAVNDKDKNGNPLTIVHDTIPPNVVSVNPANNATNVSKNPTLQITFNENLRPATVTSASISLKLSNTTIAGNLNLAGNVVSFTPSANLAENSTYTIYVTGGTIQDLAGNVLNGDFSSQFTVPGNQAPVAVIAPINPNTMPVGSRVQLNGSGSYDPENTTLSYQWSFSAKPAGSVASFSSTTAPNPNFVMDVEGSYQVQLVVSDSAGLPSSAVTMTVIASPNTPPTALIGAIAASIPLNTVVSLNGTASSDPDLGDSIALYQWTVIKPDSTLASLTPSNSSSNPTFVANLKGDYTVELVVADSKGATSAKASVSFNVPNSAPVAAITYLPLDPYIGDILNFSGNGSSDPDINDQLNFTWTLLSKPATSTATLSSSTGSTVTLTSDVAGNYQVSLVVRDSENLASNTISVTVNVKPLDTPLLCGDLLSGTLVNANEIDNFSLKGNSGDEFLITLVETGGALATSNVAPQWAVKMPSQAQFGTYHNANSETLLVLSESGVHVVGVRASDLLTTGDYRIGVQCIKPANPNAPTLTSLTNGTIDLPGESDLYVFNGKSGDLINFTLAQTAGFTGTAANLELYSPSGNLLNPPRGNNANSEFRFTLSESGTYVVRINSYNYVATGSYSLGFQKLLPAGTVNLTPGSLTTASISSAAEQQVYYFSGSNGDWINFTLAQTAGFTGTAANLELFSPTGNLLNPARGNNANSEFRFQLTENGIYVVRMNAYNYISTGTYKIGFEKLLPVTLPNGSLSPGGLITASISDAAQQDLYTMDANAGDVVNFMLVQTAGFAGTAVNMELFDPAGNLQNPARGNNANSEFRFTLSTTGTYLIRVNSYDYLSTGTYKLGVEKLLPVALPDGKLSPGDLITASISEAGQQDIYTLDGTAGDLVNFMLIQTSGFAGTAANMELFDPAGNLVNPARGNNANSEFRFILSATGSYTMRVNAYNYIATGTYKLGMEKLLPVALPNGTIGSGNLITASITEAGQQDIYTMNGASGDLVNFTLVQTAGFAGTAANMELFDPAGNLVNPARGNNANSEFRFVLSSSGQYVIRVNSYDYISTGTYKLGMETLLPVAVPNGTITPGDLITASITEAGQQDLYVLDGTNGDLVNFILVQTAGFTGTAVNMELFDPAGNLVNPAAGNNANSEFRFTLSSTGTYVVRINAYNKLATGTYKIGMEKLLPVALPNGSLSPGNLLTASIAEAGQQDIYTMDAMSGDIINFMLVQTSGFAGTAVNLELFDPSGNLMNPARGNNANSEFRFTLSTTGTYIVRINSYDYISSGTYSVGIEKLKPASVIDGTLTSGSITVATIAAAGQQDIYTFSGVNGEIVDFALVQTGGFAGTAVNLELFDPSGNLMNPARGNNANSEFRFVLPATGTYVVRVNAYNYIAIGDYRIGFEKFFPAASVNGDLSGGGLATASITEAAQQDVYTFSATAGSTVSITLTQTAGFAGTAANFYVLAADNSLLNGTSYNAGATVRTFTIPSDGVYVIRVIAANLLATGTYNLSLN